MAGVFFGGKQIVRPGAYSVVDAESMTPISVGGQRVLALIGECEGGEPQTVKWFNNAISAKNNFISGDLLNGMKIAWAPSPELNGADLIAGIRVNPATRASHTLLDDQAGNSVTFTSKDYGDYKSFKIKCAVTEGSVIISVKEETEGIEEISDACATTDDIVTWFTSNSQLVDVTKDGSNDPVEVADYVAFDTAGTNPSPDSDDWQTCIDLLESVTQCDGIIPVTTDATVHSKVKTHVSSMSDLKVRKERRMFAGHATSETVEQITTRATNLGTHRAVLCTPGIKKDIDGTVTTLSSVFTACAVAGMWAGNDPAEPLTFDYINALGLETEYSSAEIETLIAGGVLVVETAIGKGYRIVQSVTTYTSTENMLYKELSMSTLADMISMNMRTNLEDLFVGKKNSATTPTSIKNSVESILKKFERLGWIVGTSTVPAFRNIIIYRENTSYQIEYEASLCEPNNYVLITSHFKSASTTS